MSVLRWFLVSALLWRCSVPSLDPTGKLCSEADPCPTEFLCLPLQGEARSCKRAMGFQDGASVSLFEATPAQNFAGAVTTEVDGEEPAGSGNAVFALLRWDLSSLPPASVITAAHLAVTYTNASAGQPYGLSPVLRPWVDTEVTWTAADARTSWETAGAQGATDAAAPTATLAPGDVGRHVVTLPPSAVETIQGWADAPASNHGFLLSGESQNGLSFHSFETPQTAERPLLVLETGTGP